MPKYTPEQIKERNDKVEAEMLELEKQFEIEQEQAKLQQEKQQAKLDNPIDGYYIQVLGDNEYGPEMGPNKKDDSQFNYHFSFIIFLSLTFLDVLYLN